MQMPKSFLNSFLEGTKCFKKTNFKRTYSIMTKTYITHDNGSTPFKVIIKKNNVEIYTRTYDFKTDETTEKYFKTYNPIKIFIGKSKKNRMTIFSGGFGRRLDGNSILLQIEIHKYIFIGDRIFKFETDCEIIKFESPVGNNDVPYPFAIDKKDQFYMILQKNIIKCVPKKYHKDPYDYLWGHNDNSDSPDEKTLKTMKKIKIIHKRI